MDVYAQRPEFSHQFVDLPLSGVTAHIPNVLVVGSPEDFVDASRYAIGDGYLALLAEPKRNLSVLYLAR